MLKAGDSIGDAEFGLRVIDRRGKANIVLEEWRVLQANSAAGQGIRNTLDPSIPTSGAFRTSPCSGALVPGLVVKFSGNDTSGAESRNHVRDPRQHIDVFHLLVIDEEETVRQACCDVAASIGYIATGVATLGEAKTILKHQPIDLLLLDLKVPETHESLALLEKLIECHPQTAVVVMSASTSVSSAVQAMKMGAGDYLTKPIAYEDLTALLHRSGKRQIFDLESRLLRERLRTPNGMGAIIGRSSEMEALYRILSKAALSMRSVLIMGENGTGKELVARWIHANGPNSEKPFVSLDCSALSPAMLEGELFGCITTTGSRATRSQDGVLVSAEGGTVFLDEVTEMPLDLQSKLLQAMQHNEVRSLGGTHAMPITVRVLAATNRKLWTLVEQGRFRKDLFFRLSVVNLRLPSLRDRREDIPALAIHFLERMARKTGVPYSLANETIQAIAAYDWPGNVRELEDAIESACTLSSGSVVRRVNLPAQLQPSQVPERLCEPAARSIDLSAEGPVLDMTNGLLPLAELEKQAILESIQRLKGDKLMAAKLLGIGKTTLYRKLKEYGVAGEWNSETSPLSNA